MAHRWDPEAPPPGLLVRPVRVDPSGSAGPTRRQAAGPYWRRTSPGCYVPSDTRTDLPEQRIVEQSLRLPPGGAVTGWAACRLHDANFFDGLGPDGLTLLPVPSNVGPRGNVRVDAEVCACFHRLDAWDRAVRRGVPTVTAVRATYDAMRLAGDPREAVVAMDMVAAAEVVSLRTVREYAETPPTGPDKGVIWALEHASEHSRSPNETRLRMVWELDAGLPRPMVNCPVHDRAGRLLGVVDLLDPVAGQVVEFDGAEHRRAGRQTADIHREERLRRVGLQVTRVTGMELPDRPRVAGRLLAGRDRALFVPPEDRHWVAQPPADDLHQRILEREHLRTLHEAMEAQPLPDIRELRGY